jgi:plasmid segregation protein ParM
MGEFRVIGLDVGYGYTKGKGPGRILALIRSMIGPAVEIKYHNDLIGNGRGLEIELDSGRWFVGDMARLQSPSPTSPRARKRDIDVVRLLMLGAMHRLGVVEGTVRLVTGLPVEWFTDKDALAAGLRGPHTFTANGEACTVTVSDVVIVPQPFGSFFRSLLAPDGALTDVNGWAKHRVGILDIGMHTSDYALSDSLRYVEPRSGSIDKAMARVYELVREGIAQEYGRDASLQDVEDAVRSGALPHRDGELDIRDLVAGAREAIGRSVIGQAQTLWGDGDDLSAVLVTGGGGPFFFEEIREVYPHARLLDDPQRANAEGFYRYGLRKFGA